jgi:lipopolysaccharide biosynthesis glycosyltransferase
MNKVYIGYDYREDMAYEIAKYSIEKRSKSAEVIKLKLQDHENLLTRKVEMRGNQMWCPISDAPVGTEFTFTRFLIPHLTGGWALFIDCDVILLDDISKIFELVDDKYAVMCVKHDYVPKEEVHMVDQIQTKYTRKNWASVMLFNCNHPANKKLTLEAINTWPGRDLHGLRWLNDDEIGELPKEWNHLVDVNEPNDNAKLLHYTLGGPWLNGWKPTDSDKLWNKEYFEFIKE